MVMPFGMHQGELVEELPTDYIDWVARHIDLRGRLREAILAELDFRQRRQSAPRAGASSVTIVVAAEHLPAVAEIVDLGYRAAARRHHPDVGGEPATMLALNVAMAALRPQLASVGAVLA